MFPNHARIYGVRSIYLISRSNGRHNCVELRNIHQQQQRPTAGFLPRFGFCCFSSAPDNPGYQSVDRIKPCTKNVWKSQKRHISLGYASSRFQDEKVNRSSTKRLTAKRTSNLDDVTNKLHIDPNEWQTVYRFKYIRLARVIQKIKLYQTGFTLCLALPGSVGCYLYQAVPFDVVGFVVASSVLASGMLYIMGRFCSRLVGVIYVSKTDDKLIRVAHLNFWGNREDQFFAKTDFIPFSELPDNVTDAYVNIKFYSDPDTKLHLSARYGTVYDKEEFEDLFGTHTGIDIRQIRDGVNSNKK